MTKRNLDIKNEARSIDFFIEKESWPKTLNRSLNRIFCALVCSPLINQKPRVFWEKTRAYTQTLLKRDETFLLKSAWSGGAAENGSEQDTQWNVNFRWIFSVKRFFKKLTRHIKGSLKIGWCQEKTIFYAFLPQTTIKSGTKSMLNWEFSEIFLLVGA